MTTRRQRVKQQLPYTLASLALLNTYDASRTMPSAGNMMSLFLDRNATTIRTTELNMSAWSLLFKMALKTNRSKKNPVTSNIPEINTYEQGGNERKMELELTNEMHGNISLQKDDC